MRPPMLVIVDALLLLPAVLVLGWFAWRAAVLAVDELGEFFGDRPIDPALERELLAALFVQPYCDRWPDCGGPARCYECGDGGGWPRDVDAGPIDPDEARRLSEEFEAEIERGGS